MYLYAWRKRTPLALYLADHTWVTSYDIRTNNYNRIDEVVNANENYWYSKGDFHSKGDLIGKVNYNSSSASCLVIPNDKDNGSGSILRYAIDGVCHQVSNQVLYQFKYSFKNLRVDKARGYKLSSAIYGTYGKNENLWENNKRRCLSHTSSKNTKSLLSIRAEYFIKKNMIENKLKEKIEFLESNRLVLLNSLEEEGVSKKRPYENTKERVDKMNVLIRNYTEVASNTIDEDLYKYIFGLKPGIRLDLIDKEQFQFIS